MKLWLRGAGSEPGSAAEIMALQLVSIRSARINISFAHELKTSVRMPSGAEFCAAHPG